MAILDGSRYCDRSRENGCRFGVKRHIGYGWGARASRRLRLGTGQGERFGCGVRRGECPTALSDSCVLSPSCAYSANTLPLSGSASMAVARPLRGRRGRDEVSWNRCEVEVHDVQKWRAPRREAGPPRHAAGRRIPAGSVLGPEVGVSSSEHEDGTVLSLAVAEAALRRWRRIGASLGKRVAARNVPTVRQPAVARGMGTADPAGTMAGGHRCEQRCRPHLCRKRVRPVRDRPISVNRCYRFVRRRVSYRKLSERRSPSWRIIRYGSPVSGKAVG